MYTEMAGTLGPVFPAEISGYIDTMKTLRKSRVHWVIALGYGEYLDYTDPRR